MRRHWPHVLMQAALLFSLMGDIFLMFRGELYFMLGLGSFLLTQLSYVGVFSQKSIAGSEKNLLIRKPWLGIPVLIFGAALLWMVLPQAGSMAIPVIFYAIAIMTMVLMALNRWKGVPMDSFAYVFLGALLFMLSDSMIAISRFAADILPLPGAQYWIMVTLYCCAVSDCDGSAEAAVDGVEKFNQTYTFK